MNSQVVWQMFVETGAPEIYLLFNKVRKMEESHVPDTSRPCVAGDNIQ